MLNKIFSLIKMLLKCNTPILENIDTLNISKKSLINLILLFILCIEFLIGCLSYHIYNDLILLNLENLSLFIILLLIFILNTSFSIITLVGIFFFSKDIKALIPLPISFTNILISKLLTVVIKHFIVSILLVNPILILYGINNNKGVLFYLTLFVGIFALILIGCSIIAAILILFMRILKKLNSKTLINYLISIFSLAFTFAVLYIPKFIDLKTISTLLSSLNSKFSFINIIPSTLLFKLLYSENIIFDLIVFFILVITSVYIFIFLGNAFYMNEVIDNNYSLTKKHFNLSFKHYSVFVSLLNKNIKLLFRNPILLTNCIIKSWLTPIVILSLVIINFDNFLKVYNTSNNLINILLIILFLMTRLNYVAITSISRESAELNTTKFIPVKYSIQFAAKILLSIIVGIIPGFIIIILANITIRLNVFNNIILLTLMLLMLIYSSIYNLILDLRNPILNYSNDTDIIKQNSNILPMIISTIIELVALSLLLFKTPFSTNSIYLIIILIFFMIDTFFIFLLKRKYEKEYVFLGDVTNVDSR